MPKGYWVANVTVHDPKGYEAYRTANAAAFAAYGGKFVVRGGQHEVREGKMLDRIVVIEFPSYEQALACFDSDLYQAAKALRDGIADSNLAIVEGWD